MATAIKMPQVGQDIETARILEWYVEVGQEVKEGDIIATVESDKANFEVEAFESGMILKLLFEVGETARVFEPIAMIGTKGEQIRETGIIEEVETIKASTPESVNLSGHQLTGRSGMIVASPSARRMAREKMLNLVDLEGSGPNGRIIKRDVDAWLKSDMGKAKCTPLARKISEDLGVDYHSVPGSGQAGRIMKRDVYAAFSYPKSKPLIPEPGDTVRTFNKTRSRIAERLTFSKQTIPHYYLFMDVDMTDVLEWRTKINLSGELKISINDILIKATAAALKAYPELNAYVDEEKVVIKPSINLGVAVATSDGLLVPVIPEADHKSIKEISDISRKNRDAAKRGVIGSIVPGTFTISNLGMFGILKFLPVINPPECAILSAGSIEKKAVPDGDKVKFLDSMTLGIACDHRAVDGELAARFIGCIKNNLEKFALENHQ